MNLESWNRVAGGIEGANKLENVLLFSGGLDSYLALLALLDTDPNVKLVYCKINHNYQKEELEKAFFLSSLHGKELILDSRLNLGHTEDNETAFIELRNAFLALVGSCYGDAVWFGIMAGEQQYHDCRQDSLTAFSYGTSLIGGKFVSISSPFWKLTKAEVIQQLDPKYYPNLLYTTSCHKAHLNKGIHCGECKACFRRWVAFSLNGIQDKFVVEPHTTPVALDYLDKAVNKYYGGKRDTEIIEALKRVGMG